MMVCGAKSGAGGNGITLTNGFGNSRSQIIDPRLVADRTRAEELIGCRVQIP